MLKLIKTIAILLLLVSANYAQSNLLTLFDGGVSFSPDQVSGLVNWYAQTYTKVVSSDSVTTWIDETLSDDATQVLNDAFCPRAISNELNGKSILRFDASNDYFLFNTFDYTAYSIFVVFKATPQAGVTSGLITRAYNSTGLWTGIVASDDGTNPNKLMFQVNAEIIYSTAAITGSWKIASLLFGAGTNEKQIYINGTLNSQANGVVPSYHASDVPSIGALAVAASKLFHYNGDIAEILIYNVRVSASDRAKIETYLNTKYGIY